MILLIGAISMLCDHIGILWNVPLLRVVGRFAFPLFCYQILISYRHTRSVPIFIARLLLFAIVAQFAYRLMCPGLNVLFLFVFALIILYIRVIANKYIVATFVLCSLTFVQQYHVDYGVYGLLLMLVLDRYFASKNLYWIYSALTFPFIFIGYVMPVQALGAFVFLLNLNQLKRVNFGRYFYYYFYPVHILGLTVLRGVIR